jgi:poly(A) polymerase Pap1
VVTNDALPPGSIRFKGFLRSMAQALRKANIADSVVVIDKAKVPIIKFVTIDGMSINLTYSRCCSKVMLCEAQPR